MTTISIPQDDPALASKISESWGRIMLTADRTAIAEARADLTAINGLVPILSARCWFLHYDIGDELTTCYLDDAIAVAVDEIESDSERLKKVFGFSISRLLERHKVTGGNLNEFIRNELLTKGIFTWGLANDGADSPSTGYIIQNYWLSLTQQTLTTQPDQFWVDLWEWGGSMEWEKKSITIMSPSEYGGGHSLH